MHSSSSSVVELYTQDTSFFRVLNRILRQQRHDLIYRILPIINDLINHLRQRSSHQDKNVSLILYRGQQLTIFEIEKLKNNIGECVAVSSFCSTAKIRELADIFAGDGSMNDSYFVSVIFEIHLYTDQPMRPYAPIENSGEEEVLLSPGTKFVLVTCQKLCSNGQLWFIELKAIAEKQQKNLLLTHGQTLLLISETSEWMITDLAIANRQSIEQHQIGVFYLLTLCF